MRRRTLVATGLAFVVVTAAIAFITSRLRRVENVEWISWWLTVGCAYVGLCLVTWWVADRDRQRADNSSRSAPGKRSERADSTA